MIHAQQWLDENYPKNERKQLTDLNIRNKNLAGKLDLADFINLERLNCQNNNLTKVKLAQQASEKIKEMYFANNHNLGQDHDLCCFSSLVNLEKLSINATAFAGSLQPLEKLKKLRYLYIAGTNIETGLEYLPESVEDLDTDSRAYPHNPHPQVAKIRKQLAPYGYDIRIWRRWTRRFSDAEVKQWLAAGLKANECALATYLKKNNYNPAEINIEDCRAEFNEWIKKAPNYLAVYYPPAERKEVKKLDLSSKNLTGSLDLSDFENLEELDCLFNELTNLHLSHHPALKKISCSNNQLTSLALAGCPNLEMLSLGNNNFAGSLAIFRNLTKLIALDVSNTQLADDLECLPSSLEVISADHLPAIQAQMKASKIESKLRRLSNNFYWTSYDYQAWRKTNPGLLWLRNNCSEQEKKQAAELNLSNQNLTEKQLDLSDFVNLQSLDCSNNQLANLDFLNGLTTNLKVLNISNTPLSGNLKALNIANLNALEELDISNTNFDSGLERLPLTLKVLKCSGQIEEKLRKIGNPTEDNFAPLLKPWKKEFEILKEKQDKIIASAIPLERLFVVRGNLKQFASKWGKVAEQSKLDKLFLNCLRKSPVNELDQLSSPQEIGAHWYWNLPQWGSKITAGIGGVLAITYEPATIGGSIAAISPVIDVITTKMKESFYDEKEKKWQEFLTDADTFLDSYHELLGILSPIETKDLREGTVSSAFKNLKETVDNFLTLYDEDGNQEIDIEELIASRELLVKDLKNHNSKKDKAPESTKFAETTIDIETKSSKLWAIIDGIKTLQEAIANHRKAEHYEENKEEENKQIQAFQETNKEIAKTNQELVKEIQELKQVIANQQEQQIAETQVLPKTN